MSRVKTFSDLESGEQQRNTRPLSGQWTAGSETEVDSETLLASDVSVQTQVPFLG
jgi:hypothetical protein